MFTKQYITWSPNHEFTLDAGSLKSFKMQDKLQALLLLLIISALSICTNAVSITEDSSERIQDLIVYPAAVMVKRCSGYCARHKSCLPIVKRMVTKSVQYWNTMKPKGNHMCSTIEVEEHMSCKCECAVKENDCSEQQIYDQHNCICKCNETKEEECKIRKGGRWDDEKCVCVI
ncbi:hypothetical protein B566_EDAN014584 [Ephemera danica]|nr:hypothetical protein B566_EDAN014584 [Ephemera danica]